MLKELKISKVNSAAPVLNYEFLRAEGMKYIEQLSHKLWTDYNVHDPGVTILELLCYAITDLGYRSSFPIADMLATEDDNFKNMHEQFLSALNIFPSRPVSVPDYRKLLIDIEGVKNAWFEKTNITYHLDCMNSRLKHGPVLPDDKEVKLQGLYNIKLELEQDIKGDVTKVDAIKKLAREILHKNRNLCEDFIDISIVKQQEFILCAELELALDADISTVEAQVFYELQKYLCPPVKFRTLQEMLNRGKTTDLIFEGPVLEHGFIDNDELEKAALRKEIRLSDIISIIMDINGVLAVKDILFNPLGVAKTDNKWLIPVMAGQQPILNYKASRLVYYKDILPFKSDPVKVEPLLNQMLENDKNKNEAVKTEDLPVPLGQYRALETYESIHNHFPLNYGIGQIGLPASASASRKAKAKQLKAYLLFFDQLLANYFSQLCHVKELFSLDPDIKQTYFTQVVSSVKNVAELYNDYANLKTRIQELAETKETFLERRNKFLDHLLSRFAEQFSDYTWVMYSIYGNNADSDVINTKINFLSEYQQISSERMLAFNYTDKANLWNTFNISGFEHRIARLLGIKNYRRRNLVNIKYDIYQEKDEDGIDEYRFRLVDVKSGKILLSSSTKYHDKKLALEEIAATIAVAMDRKNYELKITIDERYYFNVINDKSEVVARRIEYFKTEEERDKAIQQVIDLLFEKYSDEGMFVVEHLLLRPKTNDENFLPVCVTCNCVDCEDADPYSFRISIVLPAWSSRFANIDFRRYVEKCLRLETPAHVLPKICWIDKEQMGEFEGKYKKWLEYNASEKNDNSKPLNEFIDILVRLRSIYPEGALIGCDHPEEGNNKFILDQTNVGTQRKKKKK